MSALRLIQRYGRNITVQRFSPGVFLEGQYTSGGLIEIQMVAAVQPMGAREVMMLPEGDRLKEAIRVFSVQQLLTKDETKSRSDVIVVDGRTFEVKMVTNHTIYGAKVNLTHYESIAVMMYAGN